MRVRIASITLIALLACCGVLVGSEASGSAHASPVVQHSVPCRRTSCPVPQPRKPEIPTLKTTTTVAAPVISACVPMSPATVNGWRSDLGRPALAHSPALEAASCAWSLNMATTGVFAHGSGGETIALFTGSTPDKAWPMWKGSAGHYAVLTSTIVHNIGCGAVSVTTSTGNVKWYATCRVTG